MASRASRPSSVSAPSSSHPRPRRPLFARLELVVVPPACAHVAAQREPHVHVVEETDLDPVERRRSTTRRCERRPRHSRSMSPRWNKRVHGSVGSSHHERRPANNGRPFDAERLDRALEQLRRAARRDRRRRRAPARAAPTAPARRSAKIVGRVGERPAEQHPGRNQLGLEHAERGRDHARAHLTEQRAPAREVRRTVRERNETQASRARREPELARTPRDIRARRTPARPRARARPPAIGCVRRVDVVHGRSLSGAHARHRTATDRPVINADAMTDTDAWLDATAQAELVARGDASADRARRRRDRADRGPEPRAQRGHPRTVRARPLRSARRGPSRRPAPTAPLHGVPFLVKDAVCHTAGEPFHCGMRLLKRLAVDRARRHVARGALPRGRARSSSARRTPPSSRRASPPSHSPTARPTIHGTSTRSTGRLERRRGGRGRGGHGRDRARQRHGRLDPVPGVDVRHRRAQADPGAARRSAPTSASSGDRSRTSTC